MWIPADARGRLGKGAKRGHDRSHFREVRPGVNERFLTGALSTPQLLAIPPPSVAVRHGAFLPSRFPRFRGSSRGSSAAPRSTKTLSPVRRSVASPSKSLDGGSRVSRAEGGFARTLLEIGHLLRVHGFSRRGRRTVCRRGGQSAVPPLVDLPRLLSASKRVSEEQETDEDRRRAVRAQGSAARSGASWSYPLDQCRSMN